jgi:hypothetical protein
MYDNYSIGIFLSDKLHDLQQSGFVKQIIPYLKPGYQDRYFPHAPIIV